MAWEAAWGPRGVGSAPGPAECIRGREDIVQLYFRKVDVSACVSTVWKRTNVEGGDQLEAVALVLVRGNHALERQREESRFLLRPRTQTGRAADALGWARGREREKETQDYSWASGLSDTGVTKGADTEIRMAAVMMWEQLGLKCQKTQFEEPKWRHL